MNIFERAVREKTRFAFKGSIGVEELWDLSLTNLDTIYGNLETELEGLLGLVDPGLGPVHLDAAGHGVKAALVGITAQQVSKAVIAYEPIWAIGTGRTATSAQAEEVCGIIRDTVKELYGRQYASAVRIQYGGSVKADNAAELFGMEDIDGGLVGGASLKLQDFATIATC